MRNAEEIAGTDRFPDRAERIMRRSVIVLSPEQSLGEAARILEREGVSGAPVTDGRHLVGVVSLADLFRAAGIEPDEVATSGPWHRHESAMAQSGRTVAHAMQRNVATVAPDQPIAEIAALMHARGVNRIPVVSADGIVVGIVARDDIVAAVARAADPR